MSEPTALETALEVAADADHWRMSVLFGDDWALTDADASDFELYARFFNTLVHFLPPEPGQSDRLTWRVAEEHLDGPIEGACEVLGAISVAHLVEAVPDAAREWVLRLTDVLIGDMLQSDAASERMAGLRLKAERDGVG